MTPTPRTRRRERPHPAPARHRSMRRGRARASASVAAAVSLLAAGCGLTGSTASADPAPRIRPRTEGVLTVATADGGTPGLWSHTEDARGGGYEGIEAGVARALAARLGLRGYSVVHRTLAQILAGDLGPADLALSRLTPTTDRERRVDFSLPYATTAPGVVVAAGRTVTDYPTLRRLRWVTIAGYLSTDSLDARIRPVEPAVVVPDREAALDRIRRGLADALLIDLPVATAIADEEPDTFSAAARLDGQATLAPVLRQGSADKAAVDEAMRSLRNDGTLDAITGTARERGDAVPVITAPRRTAE